MSKLIWNLGSTLMILLIATLSGFGQCANWNDSPEKGAAEDAHSIYRQAMKAKDFEIAFENWEKAYKIAPAADGLRDYHFIDGAKLHAEKFKTASTADKPALAEKSLSLYQEAIDCYESKGIKPSNCADGSCYPGRIGGVYAKMGYEMFYTLNSPYSKNLAAYDKAIEFAGNDLDYTIFDPIMAMAVYEFQGGRMDKTKVLDYYSKLEAIAEANADSKYGEYFDQGWRAAKSKLAPIETDIFDCEYFKPSLEKMYNEDPKNPDNLKKVIALLKKRNCDPSDPLLSKLQGEWKQYASGVNAARQAEFEANNPGILASKAYKAGDYAGAVAKYREAIGQETDNNKKASYHTSIASILFRKMKKLNDARKEAKTALQLRPNWGKPLNLIGDMYATGARNCGDSWNQRLAIIAAIDKYNAAKKDPEFAAEAQKKIGKYVASLPEKQEGFMRSVKAGDRVTVGCWIGESVTVRFK